MPAAAETMGLAIAARASMPGPGAVALCLVASVESVAKNHPDNLACSTFATPLLKPLLLGGQQSIGV